MLPKLGELEIMAAKLSATASALPPGQERQGAFREIARFRDKIAALKAAADSSAESMKMPSVRS